MSRSYDIKKMVDGAATVAILVGTAAWGFGVTLLMSFGVTIVTFLGLVIVAAMSED